MLEIIIYAVLIGVAASVYKNVLLYEDVLKWWVKIGQKRKEKFYYKPLWGCDKCFAGQLCLWFILLNAVFYLQIPFLSNVIKITIPIINHEDLNALNLFIMICVSILTTILTSRKINNQ